MSPLDQESTIVRLEALSGRPLADKKLLATVVSAAHALAERERIALHNLRADGTSVTVTLGAGRVVAFAFMLELRRNTNAWYESKFQTGPLWGSTGEEHVPEDTEGGLSA